MKFKISNTEVNNSIIETVSGRELYSMLGSKQHYGSWIESRIKNSGLTENNDYIYANKIINRREEQDYALSINSAIHIAMMEKSKEGREVRNYFIERDKIARKLEVENKLLLEKSVRQLKGKIVNDAEINKFNGRVRDHREIKSLQDEIKVLKFRSDGEVIKSKKIKSLKDEIEVLKSRRDSEVSGLNRRINDLQRKVENVLSRNVRLGDKLKDKIKEIREITRRTK